MIDNNVTATQNKYLSFLLVSVIIKELLTLIILNLLWKWIRNRTSPAYRTPYDQWHSLPMELRLAEKLKYAYFLDAIFFRHKLHIDSSGIEPTCLQWDAMYLTLFNVSSAA
jgi:hypothetical protein